MPKHKLTIDGKENPKLTVGDKTQLDIQYLYENGSTKNVSASSFEYVKKTSNYTKTASVEFKSNNPSVVKVADSKNGKLEAVGAGEATITMTRTIVQERSVSNSMHRAYSYLTADIKVKVEAGATPTIKIDGDKRLVVGKSIQLTAKTENAGDAKITWTSSNKNVATVNEKGAVAGKKAGDATITATITVNNKKYSASYNIVVQDNNANKKPTTTKAVAVDKSGTEIKVDNYLKYTDRTNENGWNLRESQGGKITGVIEEGSVLKVTNLATNSKWVKVEVIEGNLKGKTGWINITTAGKQNFEIIEHATQNSNNNNNNSEIDIPELDMGGFVGVIMKVIKTMLDLLINTVLPNVQPIMENVVLPAAQTLIGTMIQ